MKPAHWILFLVIFLIIIATGGTMAYKNIQSKNPKKWTDKWNDLFIKYGQKFGVRPELLKAIAMKESSLRADPGYEPIGGTWGIMQIKLSTAQQFEPKITQAELMEPEAQIRCAAQFVAWLQKQFPGDEAKAIQAYNAGAGGVKKGVRVPDYLAKVNGFLNELGVTA